jgi:rubredoxin
MEVKKLYRLYCEICGYSRWSDGTDIDGLVNYDRSPIQTALPKYDPKLKKITQKDFYKLPKQFKCPQCGRLITPRKQKLENKNEKTDDTRNQDGNA